MYICKYMYVYVDYVDTSPLVKVLIHPQNILRMMSVSSVSLRFKSCLRGTIPFLP